MRDPMTLKKSETLEVRLPHATKQVFMARCRSEGRSASEAVRDFIEAYVDGRAAPAKAAGSLRWLAGLAAALAFGAVAAPSLALPNLAAEFARLDANHDGRISPDEFNAAAALQVTVSLNGEGASAVRRLGTVFSPGAAEIDTVGAGARLDAGIRRGLVRDVFDRVDLDKDGQLSFREFRRYRGR